MYNGIAAAEKVVPAAHSKAGQAELAAVRSLQCIAVQCSLGRRVPLPRSAARIHGRHAHVPRVLAAGKDEEGNTVLYQELAVCDAHDLLRAATNNRYNEEDHFREWMLQIAHALHYCHNIGMAHRDG
ncbi:unnamed protein product, partial [Symbiodinium sp. KB8]